MSFATMLDGVIGAVSPMAGVRRQQARRLLNRSYQGAEANRLTNNKKPQNRPADGELLGPFGADAMRAWARMLVRDNAYAWGVVDTIVSSVVGCGIKAQSMYETPAGDDVESVNLARDSVWAEWCEVCDINGQFNLDEMEQLIQREIVEAGECLVRLMPVQREYLGITRPVPLALELIEADRLATDRDNFAQMRSGTNRVVRGIEFDEYGKPVAYYIYPAHPQAIGTLRQEPQRIIAADILHLFRRDRIGQSRGVSWFAPVMSWLRDLGVYVDNEIQASAVASCFTAVVKTDSPVAGLGMPVGDTSSSDDNGNVFEYLEPGMVARLKPGESIESVNPGRPNASSEPWIALMLRGISVGTGLSYEIVARDYSKTTYSSSRTSQLEDRRRFRRWQKYLVQHLLQPIWDRFCDAAALEGRSEFPTSAELLDNRRKYAPVEWQTPEWEWVDPQNEQAASQASIDAYQSTYQEELGARGRNWRSVFYQRAKEEALKAELGLIAPDIAVEQVAADASGSPASVQALALNGAQITSLVEIVTQVGTGALPNDTAKAIISAGFPDFSDEIIAEIIDPIKAGSIASDGVPQAATPMDATENTATAEMMGLSTLQWNRNVKAIRKILDDLKNGIASPAQAQVFLSSVGMKQENIDKLIADAADGQLDTPLPNTEAAAEEVNSGV